MRNPSKKFARFAAAVAVACHAFTLGVVWMPVAASAQAVRTTQLAETYTCNGLLQGTPCETPAATPATNAAEAPKPGGLVAACAKTAIPGQVPGLNCIMEQIVLIGRYVFQISGSVALLFFVTGGFLIITANGPEGVKKGKKYLTNATIGLVIILTAAYLVQFGVNLLRAGYQEGSACSGTEYLSTSGETLCCESPGMLVPATEGSGFMCQTGTGAK